MVKSEQLYSPQNYLEAVTGCCYIIHGEDDLEFIRKVLAENNLAALGIFPLSEIDHIVEHELDVVLVDCMVVNPETDVFENIYRWFEVPEDFKEEE